MPHRSAQSVATPARSLDQRMAALTYANKVRSHRGALKREIKAGRLHLADLFDDPMCETLKLLEVLLVIPKIGRSKATRCMNTCRVAPSKTLGGMTERQRDEVLTLLADRHQVAR